MRFPLSWLKDFVDIDVSPEELAEKLTMSGLEVESLEYIGEGLEDLIVAQIIDIIPHPNAQKLVLCKVTDGSKQYKIVCGATNMSVNDKVVLARPGTSLPPSNRFPEGFSIKTTKIRGELSEGMLCSEIEMGIGEDEEGIVIVPASKEIGKAIIDELGLDDYVIEFGIPPNRPDCLSVIGIAREVAAVLGTKVKFPKLKLSERGEDIEKLTAVEVLDSEGCARYACRVIDDLKIATSPNWLKNRLERSGIRSINNLVDITNYVLLEFGQPLHAFDYDLIAENRIIVRTAKNGEVIETLDGVKRKLTNEDLLICDAVKPIALAGVMGGSSTEVSDKTRTVLIESAFFDPIRIRRTSKRTNLRSDSSYRFERKVDINGVVKALDRASELMNEIAGGKISKGRIDVYPNEITPNEVKLSTKRLNNLLGTEIKPKEIKEIMLRIGIEIETRDTHGDEISFKIPSFRVDITREIDLIEELARHYGYNRIPSSLPSVAMKTDGLKKEKVLENKLRQILNSNGFLEVINYSFEDPEILNLFNLSKPLKILNPISKEGSVLRTNLLSGILRNISLNLKHQVQDIRIFEIGRVYIPNKKGLPDEINKITVAATGSREEDLWGKDEFDFYDLKGVLERILEEYALYEKTKLIKSEKLGFLHPGKSAKIVYEDEEFGFLGQLHPEIIGKMDISQRVYLFELDLDKLDSVYRDEKIPFRPIPRFPAVKRDIAVIVDEELPVGEIVNELKKVESPLIEDIGVFDVFKGGAVERGKKSVAISIVLRAADKTLTDEEVNKIQSRALDTLNLAFGAELRKI